MAGLPIKTSGPVLDGPVLDGPVVDGGGEALEMRRYVGAIRPGSLQTPRSSPSAGLCQIIFGVALAINRANSDPRPFLSRRQEFRRSGAVLARRHLCFPAHLSAASFEGCAHRLHATVRASILGGMHNDSAHMFAIVLP